MFDELKKIYENEKSSKLIFKKYKDQYLYLLLNTKFLDEQITNDYNIKIVQRLYHLINNIKNIPKCKYCENLVEFNSYRKYRIYCCNKCKINDANYYERNEKSKITKKIKYGDKNYNNIKKTQKTKLEKYGHSYFSNWKKAMNTCKEKYNVNNNLWIKEVRDKIKLDNIKKYGYDHHTKSPNYTHKFNNKKYNFINKQITIQGYENWALDILIPKYGENDIVIGKHEIFKHLGKIEYVYNNKLHIYFPDIFIKSENLIIEVKSTWTFKMKNEINLLKREICLNKGFNFNFWIFEPSKNLIIL